MVNVVAAVAANIMSCYNVEYTPRAIRVGVRDLMGESPRQHAADFDIDPVPMKRAREEELPILAVDFEEEDFEDGEVRRERVIRHCVVPITTEHERASEGLVLDF